MKDGNKDVYVFPDAAAAKRFADAMRRAKRTLDEGERSSGDVAELAAAAEAAGARIDEVRQQQGREVVVELTTNPDTDMFALEAGDPEPTPLFLAAITALVAKHGGELRGAGAVTLGVNASRLAALRAEGKQAFGVLVTPLEETWLYGNSVRWMAKVDAPPELSLRGTARIESEGEPRTWKADLVRSILRLMPAEGDAPRWTHGDVVVVEPALDTPRAPSTLLDRLRAALGL